jgi:hypothetical protein
MSAAEIARALKDRAEDIAISLLGEPSSQSRREYRWGRRGSLWLSRACADRGRWFDHERGEGGDLLDLIARERGLQLGEALRIAERDYLGGGGEMLTPRPRPSEPSPPPTGATDDAEARTRAALRIWHEAVPIAGTPAERYFREHRKLDITRLDLGHCLRWHAGSRAVVAVMTDSVSGKSIGIHRTFLDADGKKIERKMLGRQGVVRLSPNSEVTLGLGIAEGIEDGLAVLLSGWAPIWVATSAGAIARFPTLHGIEALTIFADADSAGITAANACAARWYSARVDVRVCRPTREGAHVC